MPEAWIAIDSVKIGYQISFNKYFYRHKPLRALEDVAADILALERQADGLIADKVIHVAKAGRAHRIDRPGVDRPGQSAEPGRAADRATDDVRDDRALTTRSSRLHAGGKILVRVGAARHAQRRDGSVRLLQVIGDGLGDMTGYKSTRSAMTSMSSDSEDDKGKRKPANDNRAPNGQDAGNEADASVRLDAVVLTIARLIGRRMAREDFATRIAVANDNDASPEKE